MSRAVVVAAPCEAPYPPGEEHMTTAARMDALFGELRSLLAGGDAVDSGRALLSLSKKAHALDERIWRE